MKAADFGRHIGKTFQKIDRSLDFLPAVPRKIAVVTALVAGLPIIAGSFFFLVRVPAEMPEPRTIQNTDNNQRPIFYFDDTNDDVFGIADGLRDGHQGFGEYVAGCRVDIQYDDN